MSSLTLLRSTLRTSRSFSYFSTLPTRHSRYLPPRICLDAVELAEETQKLLTAKPGTLFSFQGHEELHLHESENAWRLCDEISQRFDYLLKGYSSQVDGTIMNRMYNTAAAATTNSDPAQAIANMAELLNRIDEEGQTYMQLRQQMFIQVMQEEMRKQENGDDDENSDFMEQINREVRSQMGVPSERNGDHGDNSHASHTDNDDEDGSDYDFGDKNLSSFAYPGPTISMFDTFLDTLAVHPTAATPDRVLNVFKSLIQRFDEDGGTTNNTNIHTTPTALSFNGVLRACANTPNTSDATRDAALFASFSVYDAFGEYLQPRNAATFAYMIQVVTNFIPPSLTRGNIGLALYKAACEERVLDDIVVDAMRNLHAVSNGQVHDEWFEKNLKNKVVMGPVVKQATEPFTKELLPKEDRKYSKKLRYRSEESIY